MSQFFRNTDPTRLVHYEGLCHDRRYNDTSDMESQMYPSVEAIKSSLQKMIPSRSSAVNTLMRWEIPVVQCTNIQI